MAVARRAARTSRELPPKASRSTRARHADSRARASTPRCLTRRTVCRPGRVAADSIASTLVSPGSRANVVHFHSGGPVARQPRMASAPPTSSQSLARPPSTRRLTDLPGSAIPCKSHPLPHQTIRSCLQGCSLNSMSTAVPNGWNVPPAPHNSLGPSDPAWLAKLSAHLGIAPAHTLAPLVHSIWPDTDAESLCCRESCALLMQVRVALPCRMCARTCMQHLHPVAFSALPRLCVAASERRREPRQPLGIGCNALALPSARQTRRPVCRAAPGS